MTWAKLSDNFHSHPKTLQMSWEEIGVYAVALSYAAANLTDGFLPDEWVRRTLGRRTRKLTDGLLSARAWERDSKRGGYLIVDFLDYNPSREEISEMRAKTRERVTRYRRRVSNALVTQQDPVKDVKDLKPPLSVTSLVGVENDFDIPREISDYANQLRDANDSTEAVLADFRRRLPEAAFHSAMEALRERRERKPALVSETRYFVRLLKNMVLDGRYDA